jgi:hypothetical protein
VVSPSAEGFSSAEHSLHGTEYQKHNDVSTETPWTFSGLEHQPAGAFVTVCPTESLGLYKFCENIVIISFFAHTGLHTDKYRYIQIYPDTYTRQSE